eukprot:207792_1
MERSNDGGDDFHSESDEGSVELSTAALEALQAHAHEVMGLSPNTTRQEVQAICDSRYSLEHIFTSHFGNESLDDKDNICIELKGVNPELAQTLQSTGLTLWRSAKALADYMYKHRSHFHSTCHVLELGSGLGLCGILAAKLGCNHVVLSDGGPEFDVKAERTLKYQVERNDVSHLCKVVPITWGSSTLPDMSVSADDKSSNGLNEEVIPTAPFFEIILAADVIYEKESVEPFFRTAKQLLDLYEKSRSDGTINQDNDNGGCELWMAFSHRSVSLDFALEVAQSIGLQWEEPDDFLPRSQSDRLFIFKISS